MHGVGGAAHPDYLLGYDTLANYQARGLTAAQWSGWQIYYRSYLTPMQRADLNTALIRQSCGQWKKAPEIADLMPTYGNRHRKPRADIEAKIRQHGIAATAMQAKDK